MVSFGCLHAARPPTTFLHSPTGTDYIFKFLVLNFNSIRQLRRYRRVWNDSEFRTAVAKREQELRSGPWSDASAMATLDNAVAMINDAGIRTLTKWGAVDACPREICQQWASPQTEIDDAVGYVVWQLSFSWAYIY